MKHEIFLDKMMDLNSNSDNRIKGQLIKRISRLGSFDFQSNCWYFSKMHLAMSNRSTYTIYFNNIPVDYLDTLKYFVLLSDNHPSTIKKKIYSIRVFFSFIVDVFGSVPLNSIEYRHLNAYEQHLSLNESSEMKRHLSYGHIQHFFKTISILEDSPQIYPTKKINPFKLPQVSIKDNYIPEKMTKKLDAFFKSEKSKISLEFRLFYWLIRSFPNRVDEILSMNIDCISIKNDLVFLEMPLFKQKGPLKRIEYKKVPISYIDHGKYLVDLLENWKIKRKKMIGEINCKCKNFREDFLFLTTPWRFERIGSSVSSVSKQLTGPYSRRYLKNLDARFVNERLRELCELFDFRNETKDRHIITSHHFRHNAITDRLYIPNYTKEMVQCLTGHKNEHMAQYYIHQNRSIHKDVNCSIRHENSQDLTMAKIVEFNQFTLDYLGVKGHAYGIHELESSKGLGVCSDIEHCNKDGVPHRFCCYFCEWFVPNLEYTNEYQYELDYWKGKVESLKTNSSTENITLEQATEIRDRLFSILIILNGREGDD